jgi:hypothetical protein
VRRLQRVLQIVVQITQLMAWFVWKTASLAERYILNADPKTSLPKTGRKSLKPRKPKQRLAVPAGLEPATRGVEIRYSIQLSYGTVGVILSQRLHSIANMKNPPLRQPHPNHFPRPDD